MWRQYTECEAGSQNEARSHRYKRDNVSTGLIESSANAGADDQAEAETGLHTREHRRHLQTMALKSILLSFIQHI